MKAYDIYIAFDMRICGDILMELTNIDGMHNIWEGTKEILNIISG